MKEKKVFLKKSIFDLLDDIKAFLEYMKKQRLNPEARALRETADRSWMALDEKLINIKDFLLRNTETIDEIESSVDTAEEENEEAKKEAGPLGLCPVGQRRPPKGS